MTIESVVLKCERPRGILLLLSTRKDMTSTQKFYITEPHTNLHSRFPAAPERQHYSKQHPKQLYQKIMRQPFSAQKVASSKYR